MDKTKQTMVAAVVAMLVVVAGGWFLLISPQRSQVASLNDQTQTIDSKNASLQTQIAQLKAQSAGVSEDQATLAAIAKRLPPDLQEANLLDDLGHAAKASNVDLQSVAPSAPILATPAGAAAAPTAAATSGAAAGAAGAPKAPVAVANQLYQVPLNLTVQGNYFDLEMFVHSLEGMQRAMVITSLTLGGSPGATAAGSGADGATAAGTSAGATAGTGTTTSKSTGSTTTTTKGTGKGKTGKGSSLKTATKPVPGTAAGAQSELDGQVPLVADSHTLTLTITGEVFSMYSPTAAAAAAAAIAAAAPTAPTSVAAPAAPTTAPTK